MLAKARRKETGRSRNVVFAPFEGLLKLGTGCLHKETLYGSMTVMKKALIIALSVLLVGTPLGALTVWKTIIEPKNTRLALYKSIITSKHNRNNPSSADQILSWLDDFNELEFQHLEQCEQIQYYRHKANLESRLASLEEMRVSAGSSLQKAAQRYLAQAPSHESLAKIGEEEFANVISEVQAFEAGLRNNGPNFTLDELASQPKNFTTNPKEVEQVYNHFILKGEQTLRHRFHPYDIPKGSARISKKTHRWSTYAMYNRISNSMTAYFDAERYDMSIAPFISVHEIFPGHHLSIQAGNSSPLCAGDNASSISWLEEGWATYAEHLADEEGFFSSPEHKLAWLDYKLTRAMRIILDVERMNGLASSAQLKEIWDKRMPARLSERFDHEFNRLQKSRHQHLGYIFGYKAILETKAKLKEGLGPKFDEKVFHDAILRLEHKEPAAFYDTVRIAMIISAAKGVDEVAVEIN